MLNKLNNLQKRLITGFSGFYIIMEAITTNAWTFFALFGGLTFFMLLEFYKMAQKAGYRPSTYWGVFVGLLIYSFVFLNTMGLIETKYFLILYPMFAVLFIYKLYQKSETNPFVDIAFTFLGITQIALPISLLSLVVLETGTYNYRIILGIFFLIWIHDIAAFFGGKLFGKNQLFPRVSPNKTWEGSISGAIAAIIMVFILNYSYKGLEVVEWMGVAVLVIFVGTYGDLVMSLYKRSIKIKDASGAIPGHGGFLDRFDGLLLASPFIVAYLLLF